MYDEPLFNPEPEETVALPPPLPVATGISFHNSVAVRVGFIAAGVVTLPLLFPMPSAAGLVLELAMLLAGGFFSVYLYVRRTGESVSVHSGARLGWITGVFSFVIVTVLFTLFVAAFSTPEVRQQLTTELARKGGPPDLVNQISVALSSPVEVLGMLLFLFVMLTLFPVVGGALGAKVLAKE